MTRYPVIVSFWAFCCAVPVQFIAADGQKPSAAPALIAVQADYDVDISFFEERVKADPGDSTAWNSLGGLYLTKLRQTGKLDYIPKAAYAAQQSLKADPTARNFGGVAIEARAAHEMHQFGTARDEGLDLTRMAPSRPEGWQILGNAEFELGDYDAAASAWKEMQNLEPASYPVENCLSRLAFIHGDIGSARQHLKTALALTQSASFPSMETVSWCFVQLGQLDFMTGKFENAEKNYQAALASSPDSYLAAEHMAELQAARQKYADAAALYKKVIERVPRPEFDQALGDVYTWMNDPQQASVWHDKALAGFIAGATDGNVYYCHHLAGFYSDSTPNPVEAVKWAKKDMELRHSIYAWDALAWALYGAGEMDAAVDADKKALALGTRDSHLLYHASMILVSAGQVAEGRSRLQEAAQVDPYFNSFHVHRF